MSAHTTHPLVGRWVRDLERLLHGIDPGERAEVLAGLREHLDGSLPADASDEDVRRVLTDLGSPQAVADEAYAECRTSSDAPEPRRWLGVTACAINALGIAFLTFISWNVMGILEIALLGVVFVLPWCLTVVLSMLTPGWTSRERVTSALLYPATIICYSLGAGLMVAVFGRRLVNVVPIVLLATVAAWMIVRLMRSTLRSAR